MAFTQQDLQGDEYGPVKSAPAASRCSSPSPVNPETPVPSSRNSSDAGRDETLEELLVRLNIYPPVPSMPYPMEHLPADAHPTVDPSHAISKSPADELDRLFLRTTSSPESSSSGLADKLLKLSQKQQRRDRRREKEAWSVPYFAIDHINDVMRYLSRIKSHGHFCTSESMSAFTNPGMQVFGDDIPLPPPSAVLQRLIEHSQHAPFGKGSETTVDLNVRETWQIDAKDVRFNNPGWDAFLDTLVRQACRGLGVAEPEHVQAQLYKLLIYEVGGKFEAHKDTERVQDMFGTLIICLPCEHEGGDVVLTHARTTKVMKTSDASRFGLTSLAWYSDVSHAIHEVTAGHRLVLTYNLVNSRPGFRSSAEVLDGQRSELADILDHTYEREYGPAYSMIFLDHRYTARNLQTTSMKGRDYQVVKRLEAVRGADMLLAHLICEGEAFEESRPQITLRLEAIRRLDGTELDTKVKLTLALSEARAFSKRNYYRRQPARAWGGGWMGNHADSCSSVYRDTVLLVLDQYTQPKKKISSDKKSPGYGARLSKYLEAWLVQAVVISFDAYLMSQRAEARDMLMTEDAMVYLDNLEQGEPPAYEKAFEATRARPRPCQCTDCTDCV